MNYRSVADMNSAILSGLSRIPLDVDVVVGIPRSGMLAASLVALHRNLPLTDLNSLLQGRVLQSGTTGRLAVATDLLSRPSKVLIVDDSLYHGHAMRAAKTSIQRSALRHEFLFGVVYVVPRGRNDVDFYCEQVEVPRVFEWNLMGHEILARACFDMDGVLCRDPTAGENDDGPAYQRFCYEAEPLWLPRRKIGWIVTSRLEKYRGITMEWLSRYHVEFGELVMLDLPDKESRVNSSCHGTFKGEFYRSVGADLFIESSLKQATEIARISEKNVLCVETGEMLQASMLNEYRMRIKSTPKNLRSVGIRAAKTLLPDPVCRAVRSLLR